ncbi:MAG: ATP phosphoribosyltransferase [Planctomycetes bacterium ADurb.Bin126]|nr:MAG: ATP phosphoribosyltransferase [Planctomycetes bacterium ADurb.Bin126]HOD82759.1 ATP phosphoribosyltransferase [Phycisphaerae bacterium]HQL73394.1 ATP phosphoribosyltransferase [Phycisphaerae bacterium]
MAHKTPDDKLVLGFPKGSLQESTLDLFTRAGFNIQISSRSYTPTIDDDQISVLMFRAQEMSRYVEDGVIDAGLTGHDWVMENQSDVQEVAELIYAKQNLRPVRWVLAVPEESAVQKAEDLDGGIVATELVNVTRNYFTAKGVQVKVEFSWGATEIKARLLDGIVDVTETGSSLRANKLRVVDTLLTSTTRFIANRRAMASDWKRQKIENIALLLQGAIAAREKVGLKMNIPRANLDAVAGLLPAEKSPTISALADPDWVALEVIVEERIERELVPQLKRAGATGIITYPLNKVIP